MSEPRGAGFQRKRIGTIPEDWNIEALGDVAVRIQDGTHFSPVSKRGPRRYITSKNIRFGSMDLESCGWISEAEHQSIYGRCPVQFGDVLLTKDGANTGNATLNRLDEPFSMLSSVALIRLDNKRFINSYLLHYLLSAICQQRLKDLMSGNAITRLTLQKINAFEVPFPDDPAEQRRIAEILDTADAAIQKTEALIAKLKEMKAGLLHDLLTRGIDDNGELREPADFVDGIPNQWKKVLLREVVPDTEYGISTSLQDLGDLPVLRMNNFQDGEACLEDIRYASTTVPTHLLLKPGDVLFNRTNSYIHVGRTGIWRGQIEKATFASYLVRLNPDKEQLTSEYLNHWLNLPSTQVAIRKFATPAVQQVNINPTMLCKSSISLPRSVAEQQEITRRVDGISNRIISETIAIEKLHKLKAGLMHDLLTGKKRVNQPALAAT